MDIQPFLSELQKIPNLNEGTTALYRTLMEIVDPGREVSLVDINDVRILHHRITHDILSRKSFHIEAMQASFIKAPFFIDITADDFV